MGLDLKRLNITLHHLNGSQETDDFSKRAKVKDTLWAHSSCHKEYHMVERQKKFGNNHNSDLLAVMEHNVRTTIKENR